MPATVLPQTPAAAVTTPLTATTGPVDEGIRALCYLSLAITDGPGAAEWPTRISRDLASKLLGKEKELLSELKQMLPEHPAYEMNLAVVVKENALLVKNLDKSA